jgi:hypothetical protein
VLEAFALCPGSLPVVGTACNAVSGAAGNIAGAGVGALFSELTGWVGSGAVWLITQVARAMSATTSIDLDAGWFTAHETVMASLAAVVVLPMACCAAIQAIYRQSASMLLRTFLVHLPLSLLLTGVVVTIVRMALSVTDAMSATVLSSAGVDTANLFSGLFVILIPATVAGGPSVPGFVALIGGLLVAAAALVLWLELVVRAMAVSVAVLFLPLALAALVWPSVAHWCRRLADTLVALILSKFVVAAVLSLAASAVAGGLGLSSSGNGGGFASVVTGIALLLIATLSPFTLLRLVPAVEAGAVAHLESTRHRLKNAAAVPARAGKNLALEKLQSMKEAKSEAGETGTVGTDSARGTGGGLFGSALSMVTGGVLGRGSEAVPGASHPEAGAGGSASSSAGGSAGAAAGAGAGAAASRGAATGSGTATQESDSKAASGSAPGASPDLPGHSGMGGASPGGGSAGRSGD